MSNESGPKLPDDPAMQDFAEFFRNMREGYAPNPGPLMPEEEQPIPDHPMGKTPGDDLKREIEGE